MCGIFAFLQNNPIIDDKLVKSFMSIKNRGPDSSTLNIERNYITGFHRLAINDLSVNGNQPFYYSNSTSNYILMANAEIYNHKELEHKYDVKPKTTSDCAVLLEMFLKLNEDFEKFNNEIQGEYAIVIIKQDKYSNNIQFFISTDPLSVRPLFYFFKTKEYKIGISSLLSGLCEFSDNVIRIEQGSYIIGETDFSSFMKITSKKYSVIPRVDIFKEDSYLYQQIVNTLKNSIKIRLESDRPLGCLLSGGLDSSLVAAIASNQLKKVGKKLRTFSIGMEGGTDLYYARKVAEHIGSIHTEYNFTAEEGLEAIEEVIKACETYDITTIRASVGQYLISKNISTKTDIKVLLNGDGADECEMGYLYFYLAPDFDSACEERNKLIQQIHLFDGLRVDRNISYHGLEARVPFLDKEFVNLYYKISPFLLIPTKKRMEKYLIRKAFSEIEPNLLPEEVLWRKKEAFSDGVSPKEKSWYLIVKEKYNQLISDKEFETRFDMDNFMPICKESFYYRKKFNELFGDNEHVIPRYWLANWTTSTDPSARTLKMT
jgi:asparagine synthase (glutamine-hydrolysing)